MQALHNQPGTSARLWTRRHEHVALHQLGAPALGEAEDHGSGRIGQRLGKFDERFGAIIEDC